MRQFRLLPLLAAPLLMGSFLPMCQGELNPKIIKKIVRPGPLNEEMAFDINTSKEPTRFFARQVTLAGKGTMTVTAKAASKNAEIEISVWQEGAGKNDVPVSQGNPPLEVPALDAGDYYVVVKLVGGGKTKGKCTIGFKPDDPEADSGPDQKPQGANKLQPGGRAAGTVDYNAMDATDYLVVKLTEGGALTIKPTLTPKQGTITVELKTPKDGPSPIDPATPYENKEAVAGEYLIKVVATEGAAGDYTIETIFEAGDPCGAGGEDCTAEGATELMLKPKPGGTTQVATAKDQVDFDARDARDWFKVVMPDKGKLSVVLKNKDRAAKVYAELIANEDDEDGQKIRTGFNVDVEKKTYWVKVFAAEKGAKTPYVLEIEYFPNSYIQASIVEIDKKSGCVVIVNKGTNAGVRPGVNADVMLNGASIASGFVDQAFPLVTRVRLTTNDCSFKPGTPVQIQGM